MGYSTGRRYPSHGDCSNFVNGFCRLNGSPIDPNGPVCSRYTPKSKTKRTLGEARINASMRGMIAYPYSPLMHPQMPRKIVRAQEEKALMQQLEELERQLKEVSRKLEKLKSK